MAWTKRQFVQQAFEELGLANYFFDLQPEQLNSAMYKMDAMVAGWNANGVRINYPLPSSPQNADLDHDTGVPDFANEAIYLNLAVRLAPSLGKQLSMDTKANAKSAYENMANQVLYPLMERQMPREMPRGQGTKPWRNYNNPFVIQPEDPVDAGSDGPIDLNP